MEKEEFMDKVEHIRQGFKENKSDKEIAKELKSTANAVQGVRKLLGLSRFRGARQTIFESSRAVTRNGDSSTVFINAIRIPKMYADEIGLNLNKEYQVKGTIKKMQIVLDFSER